MNTHNLIQIAKEFGFQLSVELLIYADGLSIPESSGGDVATVLQRLNR